MLKRALSLFVGFITLGIVKLEESNPELLLSKMDSDIEKQMHKSYDDMVNLKVNLKLAERQMEKSKNDLQSLNGAIEKAIQAEDEDLLVQIYIQEKGYQKTYDMSKKLYDDMSATHDKISNDYKLFKTEMESRKLTIGSQKAQIQVNKMRKNMAKTFNLEFANVDTDRVSMIIDKQTFEIEARQDVDDDTVSTKIKRLTMESDMDEARLKARVALNR